MKGNRKYCGKLRPYRFPTEQLGQRMLEGVKRELKTEDPDKMKVSWLVPGRDRRQERWKDYKGFQGEGKIKYQGNITK